LVLVGFGYGFYAARAPSYFGACGKIGSSH
jgi:hypothetical protein